jgi:predicted TIM-barrel fold metal-dependent hydrolase
MLKRTLSFVTAATLTACSTSPNVVRTPQSEAAPLRIIDAHAHFQDSDGKVLQGPSPKMLDEFKASNVVGAVVHASRSNAAPTLGKDLPVKFALCAAIVPKLATVRLVEKGLKAGQFQCMKVYLGYVGKWATDPFYLPFYRLAEKYDVPVVFHTGDTYDKMAPVKFADPLTVDDVAIKYPKVKFVIAHMGNPWFRSAAEVVYKNDNVYVDMSALMLGDLAKEEPEKVEELVIKPMKWFFLYVENPKKFMFGTDWPLLTEKSYIDVVKRAIPQKYWEDVFYNNAIRVFKTLAGAAPAVEITEPAKAIAPASPASPKPE